MENDGGRNASISRAVWMLGACYRATVNYSPFVNPFPFNFGSRIGLLDDLACIGCKHCTSAILSDVESRKITEKILAKSHLPLDPNDLIFTLRVGTKANLFLICLHLECFLPPFAIFVLLILRPVYE